MHSTEELADMPTRARRIMTQMRVLACLQVVPPVVKERTFSTVKSEAVLHYTSFRAAGRLEPAPCRSGYSVNARAARSTRSAPSRTGCQPVQGIENGEWRIVGVILS